MDLLKVIIESERLRLVPTSEKYAEEIFKEFTPEITEFMYPKSPKRIEETLAFIRSSIEKMNEDEELQVVILDKKTGEFIGHGGLKGLKSAAPEPGIWIKKGAFGHKYGREAVRALKEWAEHNLRYKYLVYPVAKKNIPSRKIAESLGGVVEREMKKTNMSGNILDMVEYRIYK